MIAAATARFEMNVGAVRVAAFAAAAMKALGHLRLVLRFKSECRGGRRTADAARRQIRIVAERVFGVLRCAALMLTKKLIVLIDLRLQLATRFDDTLFVGVDTIEFLKKKTNKWRFDCRRARRRLHFEGLSSAQRVAVDSERPPACCVRVVWHFCLFDRRSDLVDSEIVNDREQQRQKVRWARRRAKSLAAESPIQQERRRRQRRVSVVVINRALALSSAPPVNARRHRRSRACAAPCRATPRFRAFSSGGRRLGGRMFG